MAPEEPTQAELGWYLQALEKRVAELNDTIKGLPYVPRGEYTIEMRAMAEQIKSTHSLAMWSLGTVVGGVLIAILVTLVLRAGT